MADKITVPRPAPDECVIAVCTEDGAVAWVKGSKASIPVLLAQLIPVIEENEQRVHDSVDLEASSQCRTMAAQGNTTVTVTVADLPQVRAALAGAVEACVSQRRVLLTAIQGSCACENCKAFLVDLVSAP